MTAAGAAMAPRTMGDADVVRLISEQFDRFEARQNRFETNLDERILITIKPLHDKLERLKEVEEQVKEMHERITTLENGNLWHQSRVGGMRDAVMFAAVVATWLATFFAPEVRGFFNLPPGGSPHAISMPGAHHP